MFESITITDKQTEGQRLDLAFLAETLLFYGNINLIADKFLLPELFKLAPPWDIAELLKDRRLNLFTKENYIGIPMYNANGLETYDVQTLSSDSITKESLLFDAFVETGWPKDDARRATTLLRRYSETYKYELSYYDEIKSDLTDNNYLRNAICSIIMAQNPGVVLNPNQVQASYEQVGTFGPFQMHRLNSNINFNNYPNSNPSSVLISIAEARGDIHIASHFGSEIACRKISSTLIQNRFDFLVEKFENNQVAISQFQGNFLAECKTIGEAVRSGHITFKEYMKILERADKFRHWLYTLEPNADLIKEFNKVVFKKSWADKLPNKWVRFAIFNGAGIIIDHGLPAAGTALSTALSATDNFLVDKIIKGWKPNQFIDEIRDELPPSTHPRLQRG